MTYRTAGQLLHELQHRTTVAFYPGTRVPVRERVSTKDAVDEARFRQRLEFVGMDTDFYSSLDKFRSKVVEMWQVSALASARRHDLTPGERADWAAAQVIGLVFPNLKRTGSFLPALS